MFIQMPPFSRVLDDLILQGRIVEEDFEDFEQELLKNPQAGDVIPGLGGLREIRLKGANLGKRGGFRVDYLDIPQQAKLYLIVLYPKNVKTDLSPDEKKIVCNLVKRLKKEISDG